VVEDKVGPTLQEGYEDSEDYSVLLSEPTIDDTVQLVAKADGNLHQEYYFDVRDKLQAMTPVTG